MLTMKTLPLIALTVAVLGLTVVAEARAGEPCKISAAIVTDNHAASTDISARRRRYVRSYERRYRDDAAARAFFGAAIGTVGAVIADQRRQDYYRQQYFYGGTPYYGRRYYGGPGYYGSGYYGDY